MTAALTFLPFLVMAQADAATAAAVLRVPGDFPTIQAAIDAAAPGDTVLVSRGTYVGAIDFHNKAITVQSTGIAAATVIDGNHAATVVRIDANPGETPVLRGFTIRNGTEIAVATSGGPALIEDNRVTGNAMCDGAVVAEFSAATIRRNVIVGNDGITCSGGGGGVFVGGAGTVSVVHNTIAGNTSAGFGGGITLFAAGVPTISGNVISNNVAPFEGGGMWIVNASNASITNNLIVGNSAGQGGGGLDLGVPSGEPGPAITNNTFAGNSGPAVLVDGFDNATRVTNNVIVGTGTAPAFVCGDFTASQRPVVSHNDVVNSPSGPRYGGNCADLTGSDGNISADPRFANPARGNFHLRRGSPAIDAGLDSAAPDVDIDGNARPFDGDRDGVAVADLGADEFIRWDRTLPAAHR